MHGWAAGGRNLATELTETSTNQTILLKKKKKVIEKSVKLPGFALVWPDLNILIICIPPLSIVSL